MRGIGKWQVGNRSVPIQFARKRGPCVYQTTCQSFAHPIFHERLSQQCSATQIQSPSILLSLLSTSSPVLESRVYTWARTREIGERGEEDVAKQSLPFYSPGWILTGHLLLRPPSSLAVINVQVNSENSFEKGARSRDVFDERIADFHGRRD